MFTLCTKSQSLLTRRAGRAISISMSDPITGALSAIGNAGSNMLRSIGSGDEQAQADRNAGPPDPTAMYTLRAARLQQSIANAQAAGDHDHAAQFQQMLDQNAQQHNDFLAGRVDAQGNPIKGMSSTVAKRMNAFAGAARQNY